MSKMKVQTVSIGQLWAFWNVETKSPAYNPGRDDSDSWSSPLGQIPPDMANGYDMSKGTIITYTVNEISKLFAALNEENPCDLFAAIAEDPVAVAMLQREERIAEFRELGEKTLNFPKGESGDSETITYDQLADSLESVKGIKPTDFALCGQRRNYAAPGTVVLAQLRGHIDAPREYEFYATRREFTSIAVTHKMLADENAQNSKAGYSPCGLLRNAIIFLAEQPGITELDLGRQLGLSDRFDPISGKMTQANRGNRQKYHRWAMVASIPANGGLKIFDRIKIKVATDDGGKMLYSPNGGIPAGKLDKETAQVLLGRTKDGKVPARYVPILGEKQDKPASPDQVEAVIKNLISGYKPPVIDRKNMENWTLLLGDVQVSLGDCLTAIIANDFAFFNELGHKTPLSFTPSTDGVAEEAPSK